MMTLDDLWENIFSDDADKIQTAWNGLDNGERASVLSLLERIEADPDRIGEQRASARFALNQLAPAPQSLNHQSPPTHDQLPPDALNFARTLARDVGDMLRGKFGLLVASKKKDDTLVTDSDIESDRRIAAAIKARYPDHGVLSEESNKIFGGEEWCWVIDPIDGTTNFTWGYPVWGVLIGLLHRGVPVLGVAEFPMTGEQYYAVKGGGAFCSGSPIFAAGVTELDSSRLFTCCTRTLKFGRPNVPMKIRIGGATAFDLAMLACGACIGLMEMTVHVWDVAALLPIVHEAGALTLTNSREGVFPLKAGTDYTSVVFSILGACTDDMCELLKDRLSDRFVAQSS